MAEVTGGVAQLLVVRPREIMLFSSIWKNPVENVLGIVVITIVAGSSLYFAIRGMMSGIITTPGYLNDKSSRYERQKQPTMFWTWIGIYIFGGVMPFGLLFDAAVEGWLF